jgi:TolB-like protein
MDPERWKRLRELFDAALALEAPERPAFITRSCEGDPDLQNTLESLLEHSLETGSTFDQALIEAVDLEGSIPTSLDFTGRTLGHYRIVEKIGEGGMGEVYRATDTRLCRDVAIKILPEGFTRDPERMARFKREARVLASLNHPNIATIHGIEETEGTRYLVLELVGGMTLRSMLVEGVLSIKTLVRLAVQIAEGLAKAHEAGIVHRDLKPENLMLTDDGFIKILDFGLAKAVVEPDSPSKREVITVTGRIMGTASYMSPEQARGEEVDHRSDQFAFGSVLYEMATGTRAFGGPTDAETLVAIMREEPERPEDFDARVPRPLLWIIEHCMAKEPKGRYESTHDLARDLRGLPQRLEEISGIAATGDRALGRESASIAVLPLENLGPGEQEYFADGMTDALITNLSKIEALKVISRMSVLRYKGTEKSLREIARKLGVETVLTGSVLHAGDRVRISTQLTEANGERILWAESYERNLDDVLALQAEVARAVSVAVNVEVQPDEELRFVSSRKVDPEAHEAYLRGTTHITEGGEGKPDQRDSIRASIGYFLRAIELEPDWAEPHAQLAEVYRLLASLGGRDEQWEFYPKAKRMALRALELDDTLAWAHLSLGLTLMYHEWDWSGAERSILRAVELDANQTSAGYGRFLMLAGRFDEAAEQHERALERRPESPVYRYRLGLIHLYAGRLEQAEAEARMLFEVDSDSVYGHKLFGNIFIEASKFEDALTEFEKIRDDLEWNPWEVGWIPYARAMAGDVESAREMLEEIEIGGRDCWYPELYMALGKQEKAMAQIEAAFAVRRDVLLTMRSSVEYERLMEIPRIREIIDAIGFPN